VYAGHILPPNLTDVYLGYLMIEPKRHVTGLGELTDQEAAAMGVLANNLARSLKEREGAEHVYSFVLGHDVPHLHIHLVPRYPGTPADYWGVRVGQWPDAPRGGPRRHHRGLRPAPPSTLHDLSWNSHGADHQDGDTNAQPGECPGSAPRRSVRGRIFRIPNVLTQELLVEGSRDRRLQRSRRDPGSAGRKAITATPSCG